MVIGLDEKFVCSFEGTVKYKGRDPFKGEFRLFFNFWRFFEKKFLTGAFTYAILRLAFWKAQVFFF